MSFVSSSSDTPTNFWTSIVAVEKCNDIEWTNWSFFPVVRIFWPLNSRISARNKIMINFLYALFFSAMSIAESSKFPGYGEEASNGSANSFTLSHSSSASSGFSSSAATGTSRPSSFSQRNAPLWTRRLQV